MNIKSISKTKIAFLTLLIHFAYVVLFAIFMLTACLLEALGNIDGIYLLLGSISIAMLCFLPIVTTGVNGISIFFQISALRNQGSKVKNIIMMVSAISYEVTVIAFFVYFWQRTMGV